MANYPIEIFCKKVVDGNGLDVSNESNLHCEFSGERCNKKSRMIGYPMGVCSVQYGEKTVAICPQRFLQNNTVFLDIALHYFGSTENLIVLKEVQLPDDMGNCDYVMVKHRPLSNHVEDFIIIEFQSADTSNTGGLVRAIEDHVGGVDVRNNTYSFGINYANIWKRTFTQILTKGLVAEQWNKKIYWVIQEPVYQDFIRRYSLGELSYSPSKSTIFAIYDLLDSDDHYEFCMTRMESSSIPELFRAFQNLPIPNPGVFIERLEERIRTRNCYNLQGRHV